ncbi:MraY family glycosyltransferase [Chlorobium sp.]|uniref:MraY family glycosyltransferase n=1 Tax=Chlorobium sp. TaxID=1095 RepID=UPI002F3F6F18
MLNPKFLFPVPVIAAAAWDLSAGSLPVDSGIRAAGSDTASVIEAAIFPLMEYTGIYFTALVVSFAVILLLRVQAEKLGLIDMPDGVRKIHTVAKPLVGGLGMVAGVIASMLVFLPVSEYAGLLPAILIIATVGFFDDRHDVSFKIRFAVQALATILVMHFSGAVLHSFGNILGFGPLLTGPFAYAITIFCVIGVINAMNMIDGLDGLAGSISLIAFSAFGILAWLNGQTALVLTSVAFVGALAAFLRFNWFPSKLFMGDAGSMTLGFSLAFFAIQTTQGDTVVSPAAALLVLALPVSDTIVVMIKRMIQGKSPFYADKTHFHHVLKAMGLDHRKAVIIMATATAASSGIAIVGTMLQLPDALLFTIYLFCFAAYFAASYRVKSIYRVIVWLRRQTIFNIDLDKVLR